MAKGAGRRTKADQELASLDSFFSGLAADLKTEVSPHGDVLNILEFLEKEVDSEMWLIELNIQQRIVLKTFYGLELDEEEEEIMDAWRQMKRTTHHEHHDNDYQALVMECGRRGGKTMLASVITVYEFYKLAVLSCPQAKFGIARSTPISLFCIATAAAQTKNTVFRQVTGLMRCCPFFIDLEERGSIFIGESEVSFKEKGVFIYSGNSQSSSQVGHSIILLVMDEVARFKTREGTNNALELWSNLGVSGVSFGKDARRVAISSAWEEEDAIQRFYKTSEFEDSWLGFRFRSWDLNPKGASRDNPIVQSEYSLNYDQAALEFEGIRPSSRDRKFFDEEEVKRCFQGSEVIKYHQLTDQTDRLIRFAVDSITPARSLYTVLHIDPAFAKDAYAMAFGHAEHNREGNTVVHIDGMLAWEPDARTTVSITNVQSIIYEIHAQRPLSYITSDHHNSAETIQRLKARGLRAEALFFSNRLQVMMYDAARQLMHENRLILPYNSQFKSLARRELTQVELINGNKIDHPEGGSKDLADCICPVAWHLAGATLSNVVSASSMMRTKKVDDDPRALPVGAANKWRQNDEFQVTGGEFMREMRQNRTKKKVGSRSWRGTDWNI